MGALMTKFFKTTLLSITFCLAGMVVAHASGGVSDLSKFRGLLGTLGGAGAATTCVALFWGAWYGKRVGKRDIAAYEAYLKKGSALQSNRRRA